MKTLFTILAIVFCFAVKAQKVQNDTLVVSSEKIHYVKIGDKVYKVNITLEEQNPVENEAPRFWNPGIHLYPSGTGSLTTDSTIFINGGTIKQYWPSNVTPAIEYYKQ